MYLCYFSFPLFRLFLCLLIPSICRVAFPVSFPSTGSVRRTICHGDQASLCILMIGLAKQVYVFPDIILERHFTQVGLYCYQYTSLHGVALLETPIVSLTLVKLQFEIVTSE